MLKKFFVTDPAYKEMTQSYKKSDGFLAIALFILLMLAYYLMGRIYLNRDINIAIPVNLLVMLLFISVVLFRKQSLNTIGITIKKAKKSVILGLIMGTIAILVITIPPMLAGGKLISLELILHRFLFYLIIIGFTEEIIFRGFIQTRMYSLIKSDFLAILVTGFCFSLMHIPFLMAVQNVNLITYLQNNFLFLLIVLFWHVVFNFIYRKYNSILGGTIFHGLMDLANDLFII